MNYHHQVHLTFAIGTPSILLWLRGGVKRLAERLKPSIKLA